MDVKTIKDTAQAALETQYHAMNNIERRGLKDLRTLIVDATEELGETAKEVSFHARTIGGGHEKYILYQIRDKAKNFAAVGLQIMALVENSKRRWDNDNP